VKCGLLLEVTLVATDDGDGSLLLVLSEEVDPPLDVG
jgi:hypothetical protein